jgi:hypothetical protein
MTVGQLRQFLLTVNDDLDVRVETSSQVADILYVTVEKSETFRATDLVPTRRDGTVVLKT